jgi:hypothetical protein
VSNTLVNVLGWLGGVLILVAYAAVSVRKLEGDSIVYQSLNVVGSALLIANAFHYGAYPSAVVNVAWVAIALISLARRKPRHRT